MTSVTIDADDLEAVIHQAALAKDLRAVLNGHNNDVAIERTAKRFPGAFYTLNAAVNDSRKIPNPEENEPLSAGALSILRTITEECTASPDLGGYMLDDMRLITNTDGDELRIKKCIQMCNVSVVAQWKDGERRSTQGRICVRLTPKAIKVLEGS